MIDRILNNWTLTRVIYVVIGTALVIQSAMTQQWFGVVFGCYFASMGLFAFGCAGGNCFGGNCAVDPKQKPNVHDVDFEEVKTK